jgi:hypothetical protein
MTSHKFSVFLVACAIALLTFLTSCTLPVASAQERTFLNLSLDFLSEYQLPKQTFKDTPVGELSALAYDRQHDLLYAISDDRSRFAPARFYTLKLTLNTSLGLKVRELPPATPSISIKKVDIQDVTFLSDQDGKTYPKNTIDPEGIALSPQQSVFISSEGVVNKGIPPFVNEFDLKTGRLRQSLPIPKHYIPDAISKKQQRGVQNNLAFESLTLSPVGYLSAKAEPFRLFTATESALVQDLDVKAGAQDSRTKCRLLHYLLSDGPPLLISEHLYQLDSLPSGTVAHGLADLLALDQSGHFLSLERFLSPLGFSAKIFQVATGGATDTSQIASLKGETRVEPVKKKLLLDLSQLGITLGKLEGMTLGPRLPDGTQSLVLVSDNDFRDAQVNQFLLFRLRSER